MTQYARIADGAVVGIFDLTPEQFAAFQANGKAANLRLWIVDPQPTVAAGQIVVFGPVVITATEARQTWVVRSQTEKEIEVADIQAERAKIDEVLADLSVQRAVVRTTWDAYTANQLRAEQWKDRQVLLRLANLIARRVKQEIA